MVAVARLRDAGAASTATSSMVSAAVVVADSFLAALLRVAVDDAVDAVVPDFRAERTVFLFPGSGDTGFLSTQCGELPRPFAACKSIKV